MYFFVLDSSKETYKTAEVLLLSQFENIGYIRSFLSADSNSFTGISETDIESTFWLGHSNTEEIGGFSMKSFARKFSRDFESTYGKEKKSIIKHLYLISCEIGLIAQSGSAAQLLADYLYDEGFSGVIVHAIASPQQVDGEMLVNVVTRPQHGVSISGEVYATLYNNEQAKKRHQLADELQEYNQHCQSIRDVMSPHQISTRLDSIGTIFLRTCRIMRELDRPHNSFIPHHPELRPLKNIEHELALTEIENLIKHKAGQDTFKNEKLRKVRAKLHKKDRLTTLQKLMNMKQEVARCRGDRWRDAILVRLEQFKNKKNIYAILSQLAGEVRQSTQFSAHLNLAPSTSTLFSNHGPAGSLPSQVMSFTTSRQTDTMTNFASNPFPFLRKKSVAVMPAEMNAAIERINTRICELDEECKSIFLFSRSVKTYKLLRLRELSLQINRAYQTNPESPVWLHLIKSALEDTQLIQGVFSHRTLRMLNEIINANEQPVSEKTPLLTGMH